MQVIATAGHVDHGKSSLLRVLTGMEPDRWEEERRRGLTLDLGFVWTDDLAFVDVPGHEKFVTNMLAGVGPVPAVLFVVAADAGWSVQSQEHLEIIDALGIRHGLLAVTRADLADPSAALAEAAARMAGTSLEGITALAVSSLTGAGIAELRTALAALARTMPRQDPQADVRLWVDRAFTVAGRGTVVTGTLPAGTIGTGDTLSADGKDLHVRGLHSRQRLVEAISGPARVAVNLRGTDVSSLRRGTVLVTPGRWLFTRTSDVRLSGATGSPPGQGTWHMGSAALPAMIRPLGADTARVTLQDALPLRIGDRALLRAPGTREVWGATVLDVLPPDLRRRGAAARRGIELTTFDGSPDGAAELRRRGLIRQDDLLAMGAKAPVAPVTGDWLADPRWWTALRARLVEIVTENAVRNPHDPGIPLEAVRRELDLPEIALVDALAEGAGLQRVRGRLSSTSVTLPPDVTEAVAKLATELAPAPFAAPTSERLRELGLTARAAAIAEEAGLLLRLAPGLVLPPDALELAMGILSGLPQPFTTSEARQALNTSRRVAIPLLDRLDQLGRTRRLADDRREVPGRSDLPLG